MSAAAFTAAQAQSTFEAYSKHLGTEIFQLKTLLTKLDDGNLDDVIKNWRSYNDAFSARLKQGPKLKDSFDTCAADFSKLPNEDRPKFLQALVKTTDAFEKQAFELRSDIFGKLFSHSVRLGTDKYPVGIQNGDLKTAGRAIPPIDPQDVSVEVVNGQITINVPVKKQVQQPYLITKLAKGVWNNIGKIAFVASAIIIASQTDMGAALLAQSANKISALAEPITQAVTPVISNVVTVAKDNLPTIGSVASYVWALPNAYRAWARGDKKTAAVYVVLGTAAAIEPHALQPGFTVQGAVDKGLKLANGLAVATGLKTEL